MNHLVTLAILHPPRWWISWYMLRGSAWLWLPIVFLAYGIGRRRWSVWLMLVFTAVEGVALAFAVLGQG